jgi:DNA-nicking Smr family endonuclease
MSRKRRQRVLSEEELKLWAHVTRHDEPLARLPDHALNGAPIPGSQDRQEINMPPEPVQQAQPAVKPALSRSAARKLSSVPAPAPFDPRLERLLARGRREIDARLDLHGLRQHDAYLALRQFLSHCQSSGYRHVLIITGKGGSSDSDHGDHDFWAAEQRGVLRRLVPQWLHEPDFRLHVVSFTESSVRHGGSGALYVTIRRRTRFMSP